jgi:hypothetical protein
MCDQLKIWITIGSSGKGVTSDTTVDSKIHSIGGMDYIKLIELE